MRLTAPFDREHMNIQAIEELDEPFWFGREGDKATCRVIAEHARLIQGADLHHPIILSADGRVMDGMHRVCKALIEGRKTVVAVRFESDPDPDYEDVFPDDLAYD